MSRYIHVLNLDTLAGVEALYAFYLKETIGKNIQYTCVSGKRPHQQIEKIFQSINHTPFLERYLSKFWIPKWLRSIVRVRRQIIQGIVEPDCWIYWNRIEDHVPPGKVIYYEHGAAWTDTPSKKKKRFLSSCSSFIAASQAAAIMLREKWSVQEPIEVVANPLRPDVPIGCKREKIASNEVRLGMLGRLVPVKGVHIGIHTLAVLRHEEVDATLTIAGTGPERELAEKTAKHLGVEQHVHFAGGVDDVPGFFSQIDILLLPSIREPLGLVSLEAAACGVPVVASKIDGIPEAVLDSCSGICVEPTIELANAEALVKTTKGLPDYVVDPEKKILVEPKLLDPKLCARAIIEVLENYSSFSEESVQSAHRRSDFSNYCTAIQTLMEP